MKRENQFQSELIKELKDEFPGSIILKNDGSNVPQGFPDLLILFGKKWAALECKRSSTAHKQPNQEYYVHRLNKMSFARFISPENKEEVLDDLRKTFRHRRTTRISGSEQVELDKLLRGQTEAGIFEQPCSPAWYRVA